MSLEKLGRYEIVGILGRGAMGVVYRAHDPLIERTVAIKTISCAGLTPAEIADFEQRFFREAKSAGRLNHPNIVTIYDVGRSDDLAYITMEFLEGVSLRTLLDSGVVLPLQRVAEIAASVADGLAFAHANGIVHRDIKPANIMVLDSGAVKIADFGIALLPGGSLTMVGTALGSPRYMAPEQVLGQKADGRSDLFALGAVVYEMLTGRPPFAGDNLNAILYQVVNSQVPLPSSHNPSFPPEFDRIVAKALAKKPEERYQNAAEMAADLRVCPGEASATPVVLAPVGGSAGDETLVLAPQPLPAGEREASSAWRGARSPAVIAVVLVLAAMGSYLVLARLPVAQFVHSVAKVLRPAGENTAPRSPDQMAAAGSVGGELSAPQPEPESNASAPERKQESKARQSDVSRPEPRRKAQATPPEPDKTTGNWLSALRAELGACRQKAFFARVYCSEKARWRYCPGHWGTVDECPKNEARQHQ